jgi:cyclopropane fatty-acyl-phospholipid synthase-like methyltransferase
MREEIADNWYETFFQGINCEIWEQAIPAEVTIREVDFLLEVLNLETGAHILDIPCGFGRHSLEFAKRGYQVTGVDISQTFIDHFTTNIVDKKKIKAIRADILQVKLREKFSAAVCLGNSFGYFDFEHMKSFVRKISSCLLPGARFIINSGMIAESILSNLVHYSNHKSYTFGNITMDVSNMYNTENSFMVSSLLYTRNESQEEHAFKHYVFTMGEIKRLLESFGFVIIDTYGSIDKAPYKIGDQQVYIVAEKKATGKKSGPHK